METDTAQNFPFGYMIRAFDPIWVSESLSTCRVLQHSCRDCCHLQFELTGVHGRCWRRQPIVNLPVAIALAPTIANLFGWYQISGAANCVSVTAGALGTAYQAAAALPVALRLIRR